MHHPQGEGLKLEQGFRLHRPDPGPAHGQDDGPAVLRLQGRVLLDIRTLPWKVRITVK